MLMELRLLELAGLLLLGLLGLAFGWTLQTLVDRRARTRRRTVARVAPPAPTCHDHARLVRNRQHAWRLLC